MPFERYEILLPLKYNDGTSIRQALYAVRDQSGVAAAAVQKGYPCSRIHETQH